MKKRAKTLGRERGVAIVTALLLTTLAIMLVSNLFWQQQVQVRSLQNQRLQLQAQWLFRSSLDWVRVILREDASISSVDHMGEAWAVPLTVKNLEHSQSNDANGEMEDAVLNSNIIDAQSRYNLRNLAPHGKLNPDAVAVLKRLLVNLRLNPELAHPIAIAMATQAKAPVDASGARDARQPDPHAGFLPMHIDHLNDLLAISGMTPDVLHKLENYVVVLPATTEINVNTASAPVLAARIATLSIDEAKALIVSRDHAYFRDGADLSTRMLNKIPADLANAMAFSTSYFIVNGKVRVHHATLDMQALIERNLMFGPRTVWIREN